MKTERKVQTVKLSAFLRALDQSPFYISIPRHRVQALVSIGYSKEGERVLVEQLVNSLLVNEISRRQWMGLPKI